MILETLKKMKMVDELPIYSHRTQAQYSEEMIYVKEQMLRMRVTEILFIDLSEDFQEDQLALVSRRIAYICKRVAKMLESSEYNFQISLRRSNVYIKRTR